jgi:hypothetical protein
MPSFDHRRVFWRAAVAFGTAMAVPGLIKGQYALAAASAIVGGAIAGGLLAWLNSRGEARLNREGIVATNMDPVQVREVDIDCPVAPAFDASVRALQRIPKLKVVREDPLTHEIDAKVGATFWSFGERVTVRLAGRGDTTRVSVRSQPRLSTTTVDYGKAVQNVELFARFLKEGLTKGGAGT